MNEYLETILKLMTTIILLLLLLLKLAEPLGSGELLLKHCFNGTHHLPNYRARQPGKAEGDLITNTSVIPSTTSNAKCGRPGG